MEYEGFILESDETGHYATRGAEQVHCEHGEDICAAVDHYLYQQDEKNGTGDFEGWSEEALMDAAADEFAVGRHDGPAGRELDRLHEAEAA